MDLLANLAMGFGAATAPSVLMYCFAGCVLGMIASALPRVGPVAIIAMLLPVTYAVPPVSALVMLAGAYCGARFGSFFAGCVGVAVVAVIAPPLTELAFRFGPAEYFSLAIFGLACAVVFSSGSVIKSIAMGVLGLLLGAVGADPNSGVTRYSFDVPELNGGIGFVSLAMGMFAIGQTIANLSLPDEPRVAVNAATPAGWRRGGARFWPFIPMLALGIPLNAAMALVIGAMTIHRIQPGPQVMTSHPQVFWGVVVSLWIVVVMLAVLTLLLGGIRARLPAIPIRWLFPVIVLLCAIGIYSIRGSTFDVGMVAAFGFIGYLFIKLGCQPAPLLLGFVLGPAMEENLRSALSLAQGEWSVLLTRPISASLLGAAAALLAVVALPSIRAKRSETFVGD